MISCVCLFIHLSYLNIKPYCLHVYLYICISVYIYIYICIDQINHMFFPSYFIGGHQNFIIIAKLPCGVRLLQLSQSVYQYILQTTLEAVARKPTDLYLIWRHKRKICSTCDAIPGNKSARHYGHMSTSLRHQYRYTYIYIHIWP